MTIFVGQKLHYLGFTRDHQYGAIYAQIEKIIDDNHITIKNEYGSIFTIKKHWITGINRIVVPEAEHVKSSNNYLKCKSGNMRFSYNQYTQATVCQDCYSEYQNDEFGLLEKTEYIPEKTPDIRSIN